MSKNIFLIKAKGILKRFLQFALVSVSLCALFIVFELNNLPRAIDTKLNNETPLLLKNVNLLSMVPGSQPIVKEQSVLIANGIVQWIGPSSEEKKIVGMLVINATDQFLIPGLIDAHVHVFDEAELAGYLAHGVTGVRNLAGLPFHIPLMKAIDNDELIAPEFLTTGPILNSHGPNESINQQIVMTESQGRNAVRQQHDAGFDAIKVYSNLTAPAFKGIVEEAEVLGMSISGHSPEGIRTDGVPYDKPFDISWSKILGNNFVTLEHVETLVWHALRDDLDEKKFQKIASILKQSGEAVTPTLIAHKRLILIAETKGQYLLSDDIDTINPFIDYFSEDSKNFWSQMDPTSYEKPHSEFFSQATRILYKTGVPLIAGSDAGVFGIVPGRSLALELELLVEAGMTTYDALNSATRLSAETLGFNNAGRIEQGYKANLVLLNQNPLININAVENPTAVIIKGHLLDQAGLRDMKAAARDTSFTRSFWRFIELLYFIG